LANKRCGLWYKSSFDDFVHFKSTDGHFGVWQFSLKRLNLNLVTLLLDRDAAIIVDSTRKGRSVPDSFSRTLPMWCAVINTAARQLQLLHAGRSDLDAAACAAILTPPKVAPPSSLPYLS
jgi:tRNA A64-2'-O-ribosylphosphate transferase